ncbi:MAG: hypothetical protein QM647_01735 [Asticcacaulis sp.]|uniref:hypothetical protein n=1 Tax=Asticcacaulis sp. TaxID=1872648 RepID=UPI0039E3190A
MFKAALISFTVALFALPALAEDEFAPLTTDELREQVGGLRTPTGIDFNFGAVVTTYVDGQVALQSQLTWTDKGPVETTTGGAITGTGTSGITVDPSASGAYIPGDNGGTVVLHSLSNGNIGSIVLNTADNRDITQNTVISLDIPQLQQLQKDYSQQKLEMNLQDSVSRALANASH